MKSRFVLFLVLALHLTTPALAQERDDNQDEEYEDEDEDEQASRANPEAEAVAKEAHEVLLEYCAEAAGEDMTRAAESVAVVSDVWARVSAQVESSRKVYLLYWRGVLAQCLDQEERAREDLQTFVKERKGSALWAGLIADAEKRLARLEREATGPAPVHPGWFVGGGLAVGSLVFGIGSAAAWQQVQQTTTEEIYPNAMPGTAFDASLAKAEDQANASRVMIGASIGCGLGAVAAFVLTATRPKSGSRARLEVPVLVPTRSGAALTWQGRW